jgi:hypothetical protein
MERQLIGELYRLLEDIHKPCSTAHVQHPDHWIVLTYLWAVLCDRPVCWACQAKNWPPEFAWHTPPSPATLSRRLRTRSVQRLMVCLFVFLRAALPRQHPPNQQKWIDGKTLPVGGSSGDRDARIGWGVGMVAKGYKLHAVLDASGYLDVFTVRPLDVGETTVAKEFLEEYVWGRGYLVGDNNYDAQPLYDRAAAHGLQLVATRKKNQAKGLGHRKQSPHRLAGLAIAQTPAGKTMLRDRFGIDRFFADLGNGAGGLSPLPNFVRGLHRVRLWVFGKIILRALRLYQKQRLAA